MECFTIYANEIDGRIDPNFYRPEFKALNKNLLKLKNKQLGKIIEFSSETWNQKDFFDNEFPYIEISEIDTTTGEMENINYYNKKEAPSRAKMIVRENDIIVSTTRPYRGAIALIDRKKDGFIASTGFAILRKLKTDIDRKYLLFMLRTQLVLKQMLQRSSGGNYPSITSEELKKIIIPLPSFSVQNKIVSLMDKAYSSNKSKESEAQKLLGSINDYVLDELEIKLPELKYKMTYVVSSEDVKNNRCDAYYYQPKFEEIEKAIKMSKFKIKNGNDIFVSIESGKGVSPELLLSEGVSYLEVKNIGFFNIKPTEFFVQENSNIKCAEKGDILTGRVGSVGNFVLCDSNHKLAFSDNILRIKSIETINKYYLTSILNSIIIKFQIDRFKKGSLQSVINQQTLNNLKIPLPPLSVQNKIAEEVKRRMQKAEQLQNEAKEELEKAKAEVEKIILG